MNFLEELLQFKIHIFLFLKAVFIGISVAVPVGPVGVICVNRSINKGVKSGLFSGLGAASADVVFGLIAGFGLSVVTGLINDMRTMIKAVAFFLLLFISFRTFWQVRNGNDSDKVVKNAKSGDLFSDYFSTFILTISNPLTVFSFMAIFSGFNIITHNTDRVETLLVIFGMFIGSSLWWLSLVKLIHYLKQKLNLSNLNWINYISGTIILISAFVILFT